MWMTSSSASSEDLELRGMWSRDVVFDHLGHEAVDRPPDGRDQLQRLRAPRLSLESPFEGLDLSPDAADPADQLGFAADGVAHVSFIV